MNSIEQKLYILLIFSIIFCIIVTRRPDIIFHAQPWAEDGLIWMADAYNHGFWHSLFKPHTGYYQTISRLTYGIALLFGISHAALVANIIAISIRCFCCLFILSKRMSFIGLHYRLAAIVYFLFMPNVYEGYVNITNVHWYLSLYLFLIIFSDNPNTLRWKLHDVFVLILSGLSGPFVAFLAPCLLIKRLCQRGGIINSIKEINIFDFIMILCCLFQFWAYIMALGAVRSKAPLGANLQLFVNIISYHIIEGTFFSLEKIAQVAYFNLLNNILFITVLIAIIISCFNSGWRFFIALLFPALMVGFALASPMINENLNEAQWPLLLLHWVAGRYFYVSNFAFFCFILFLISKMGSFSKSILMSFMILVMPLFVSYFYIPPLSIVGYKEDIAKFKTLNTGDSMQIRINPSGWTMTLQKK